MSRRFRICMAKGGRESARPSYGRPKWTLISRGKKIPKTVLRKTLRPQFSYFSLEIESAVFWYIWNIADSISRLKYENCGRKVFRNTALFLLATRVLPASLDFGQAKHCQKKFLPPIHIHNLNPKCVRIPRVLAPKKISRLKFWVQNDLRTISIFHEVTCPHTIFFVGLLWTQFWCKRPSQLLVWTVIPQSFQGKKLTWCQQFGLQIFPK